MSFKPSFHSKLDKKVYEHLSKTDFQLKSYFKLMLINSSESSLTNNEAAGVGLSVLGTAKDFLIGIAYLRSITIGSVTISYEGNTEKYARDIKSPENISMNFIDDRYGTVRRYLISWLKDTAIVSYNKASNDLVTGVKAGLSKVFATQDSVSYVFADNQIAAKKIGIVILGNTKGELNPLYYPRTMLYGLRPTSLGNIVLSHEETGAITYDVEFSVDEVATPLI